MKTSISSILLLLLLLLLSLPLFAQYDCDTLVFKSGSKLIVRNISYSSDRILYEKCDDPSETSYSVGKDAVTLIKKNKDGANKHLTIDATYAYEVLVDLKTRPQPYRGLLHQLKDSSIIVSIENKLVNYQVSQINYIRVREKNGIGKNALLGAGIGLCSGFLLGILATKSSSSSSSKNSIVVISRGTVITLYSLGGLASGTVIGALSGGVRISIPIYGDQRRYERAKKRRFSSF